MKCVLRFCFALIVCSVSLFGKEFSHLILHFDINKTLIASDKAGNKNAHQGSAEQGKPFYFNSEDQEILSIFFDDNIGDSDEKNIIAPLDIATGEKVSIKTLLESKQAVGVDTLEAILNQSYYIERLQEALSNIPK